MFFIYWQIKSPLGFVLNCSWFQSSPWCQAKVFSTWMIKFPVISWSSFWTFYLGKCISLKMGIPDHLTCFWTELNEGLAQKSFLIPTSIHQNILWHFYWIFKCMKLTFREISSVQFSRWVMSDSLEPNESQHSRPPCPSPTPGVHSNSCPSNQGWHPATSSSVVPFSSCPQSLTASGSFPVSQLFAWGGQSTGVSALASVLPMNTQDWSPLEWTGWTSLQSKGLSRIFSNTTVQKHQFFSAQLSSQSSSHIHTWPLEKP